jgi:hypothetical protein
MDDTRDEQERDRAQGDEPDAKAPGSLPGGTDLPGAAIGIVTGSVPDDDEEDDADGEEDDDDFDDD